MWNYCGRFWQDQKPCSSTTLWGRCWDQNRALNSHYVSTIPSPLGTRLTNDWCIMTTTAAAILGFFLSHMFFDWSDYFQRNPANCKKVNRKVQGVPQSQTGTNSRLIPIETLSWWRIDSTSWMWLILSSQIQSFKNFVLFWFPTIRKKNANSSLKERKSSAVPSLFC